MNRRRLLLSAAGAGLAVSGLSASSGLAAPAATDDELAFASFGQAAEFLLADFYAQGRGGEDGHGRRAARSSPAAR